MVILFVLTADIFLQLNNFIVRNMPPPNEHPPSAMFLPTRLTDLVALPVGTDGTNGHDVVMKKSSGIKSLNIELSWM
jgi:hypothetical protein